jgi:diguanylate cyclase (GGDEF)-like protein/PAS domain S-box-containing protein
MRDPINQTRYRALRVGLFLVAICSLGGALIVLQLPAAHPAEWLIFIVVAVASFALVPVAERARARQDRAALERLARVMIGVATLLLLQRLVISMYGPVIQDPARYLFRPSYAFLPFLYLGAITVIGTRMALRYCWAIWLLTLALTLPALWLYTGFSPAREGLVALGVWLLVANPLFILMLHTLPGYEEQLDKSAAEVHEMRQRTELHEKLAESEQRFNLVVEGLEVGVWDRWVGPPERRWWSPRFYELIGYKPEELTPTEDHLRALLHPDEAERVWQEGTAQLAKGGVMDIDFRLKTAHRGYRWFNSHAKAERDANGRLVRLAGSIADIHEQRLAQDALRMAQTELTRLAYRDTLTDLHNRRYFEEHFQREWERARRHRQPLALVLIDLDHFKAYNDRYGHPAGDACLVEVAQILSRCANRASDIVARLGGEEFGIVLPDASATGAEDVARRVLDMLVAAALPHEDAPQKIVTLSAGVAAIEGPDGPGPSELFEHADKALYEAKRRGRNGIVRFGDKTVIAAARA